MGRVLQCLSVSVRSLSGYKVLTFFKILKGSQDDDIMNNGKEVKRTMRPHCSPYSVRYGEDESYKG